MRAVDGLKRSQTKLAAAIRTPVNLPTWGQFAAVLRTFQEGGLRGNLAIAKADYKDAYGQFPVKGQPRDASTSDAKRTATGHSGCCVPETQLFGATSAFLHYNTVSRVMAAVSVRRREILRLGNSDDFGVIATESTAQDALRAFTALNDILGFELGVAKSE